MKNLSLLFISIIAFLCSCSDNDNLYEAFALDKADFKEMVIIDDNLAMKSPCTNAEFEKNKSNLEKQGFNKWSTFNGIVGTKNKRIIPMLSYPLYYSFKYDNNKIVECDGYSYFYRYIVLYDEAKSEIYFVLASDFGG